MTNSVSLAAVESVAPIQAPSVAATLAPDGKPRADSKADAASKTPSPLAVPTRLMIEEIGNTGRFIYKVLNPLTGEVIMQLPREQVVKLSEADDYMSGTMLDTQA